MILYNEKTQELSFINKGGIPATAILLGGSTRQNDLNLIGQFGEGFKIAALVLLRGYDEEIIRINKQLPENVAKWEAKTMTILNNEYKWSFSLNPDANIGDSICLHWLKEPRTIPPEETERQVSVIMGNVTVEEWKAVYENKLLRLSP